jgi:hypothetical protein
MKLINVKLIEDYGKDLYIILIQVKGWCFIQSCFSFNDYQRSFPYLNITMGSGRLFEINLDVGKIGLCISFFTRSWFKDKT